jgi:peptidoglycan/xylan/chitin deacetylase (PgdA/CDA1 family)
MEIVSMSRPGAPAATLSSADRMAGSRLAAVLALALLGLAGCVSTPKPALQDETLIGSPLPYELPAVELTPAPRLVPRVQHKPVRHGSRDHKRIALTFDACATQGPSQFDVKVIKTLIDLKVPATLFLGGKWMEEHPDETMELATYPQFELANHTYLHPHLTHESDERVREELLRTQDMLYTLTGKVARLFRAPYGELDKRVMGLAAEQGLVSIQYDLASGDPDPNISTKRLIEYVSDRTRKGSIVVLHMNGRGWKTAEALPRIVLRLRKKGYRLVTVGQLLGLPPEPALLSPAQELSAR